MKDYFPMANISVMPIKRGKMTRDQWLEKKRAWGKIWYKNNKLKVVVANMKWQKKSLLMLRYEVLDAYGGKCSCCGESNYGFLTIDHINGNGLVDRARHHNRFGKLYAWLKENHYPRKEYRLMCMNCNWGSRHTKVCPHKQSV